MCEYVVIKTILLDIHVQNVVQTFKVVNIVVKFMKLAKRLLINFYQNDAMKSVHVNIGKTNRKS